MDSINKSHYLLGPLRCDNHYAKWSIVILILESTIIIFLFLSEEVKALRAKLLAQGTVNNESLRLIPNPDVWFNYHSFNNALYCLMKILGSKDVKEKKKTETQRV